MTAPARVPKPLDLTVDPQLVHDLADTFDARVGKKRSKSMGLVQASRFHPLEDETGVFAQPIHTGFHGPYSMDCRSTGLVGISPGTVGA